MATNYVFELKRAKNLAKAEMVRILYYGCIVSDSQISEALYDSHTNTRTEKSPS